MAFFNLKRSFTIPEAHIGVLYKDLKFQRILTAGKHAITDWQSSYTVQEYEVVGQLKPITQETLLDLIERYPDAFEAYVLTWSTQGNEVGLVYQNQVLKDILPPGKQGFYWQPIKPTHIELVDISQDIRVEPDLARTLVNNRDPALAKMVASSIVSTQLAEGHIGFLEIDGQSAGILTQGIHTWWAFNRRINVQPMDLRLQNMEVNGQEILTKDRVSLRINLSATWQIVEPALIKAALADANEFLYRELQLALRSVVSTQTLDELLEDKNWLNQHVQDLVAPKVTEYGMSLKSVGARDIILPGDMKAILAEVVEAQKKAEANLIKRREETQATRSLHNTAKVMEGNPILLRLKELEVLEKITANVQHLNVYGGLDGVMNQIVRIPDHTKPNNT